MDTQPTSQKRGSYYNERVALTLKSYLDVMLADRQDRRLRYDQFGRTPKSLNIFVLHGWNFLCDNLDPDDVYKDMREECIVTMEREGICIRFKPQRVVAPESLEVVGSLEQDKLADAIQHQTEVIFPDSSWRIEMLNWIQNAGIGGVWNKSLQVPLSQDDMQFVMGLLPEDFTYSFGNDGKQITLVRNK